MKINSVTFVKGCLAPKEYPREDLPEVAFAGRSNVGKSSLINTLLHRKSARVSSTPGKTQLIYFYLVNRSFHIVDLPGYGYARVPRRIKQQWAPALEHYLGKRRQLHGVVMIIDGRHHPTELDLQMKKWLDQERIPFCVVATKMDKLSLNDQKEKVKEVHGALGLDPGQIVIPFSAKTGVGRGPLLRRIGDLIKASSP